MLAVAVLGPVELRRDGRPLSVPAGRTTELLVRLAVDAGTPVRADRVIEDLWGGRASRNALQAKVSKLRGACGDPGVVTGDGGAYTLHVDRVDAAEVLAGRAGLEAFRGELPGYDWFAPHRQRLDEKRLDLLEERGGTIGELEALVAAHPLREGLWRLLVTALYRAGRQADALDACRRVRTLLADELGIDPGPALRDLERRILRQDVPGLGNVPAAGDPLIGRAADLAAVRALTQTNRLVSVTGPAGVGKTRLAIEVARGGGDAWLVRLDAATDGIWPDIGAAFGIAEATETTVRERLRGLDALLVLDNAEHLADHVATAALHLAGPRVLVTSQVALGVAGEAVHRLEPLAPADAVTLFTTRAVAQRRSFQAGPDEVERVCAALDGLPLAIELAAARARALPVAEIARRLDDRFALLTDPSSRRPPRQRALREALTWSYDLLLPDDKRGLWALSWFAGPAPLDAAEAVLAALGVPASAVLDVITRLVDRSLVTLDPETSRYRLLDSVRAFARERSADAGAAATARRAHAAWIVAAADAARSGLRGPAQPHHLDVVRRERPEIDTALAWSQAHDPPAATRIALGFAWGWVFLGAGAEAADRMRAVPGPAAKLFAGWFEASGGDLDRAVADIRAAGAGDLGRLFLAFAHSQQGRPADALDALDGLPARLDGWERGAAWLLTAWAAIARGDVATGKRACAAALEVLEPLGDRWALGHAEALLGTLAQAERRYADAVTHLTRAASAAERLGFAAAGALHRTNLGRAYHQLGDADAAIGAYEAAIGAASAVGDLRVVNLARTRLARTLRRSPEARDHLVAARDWYRAAGGGDGALLAECLLAVLDGDVAALTAVLAHGDGEVSVLALDALARLTGDASHAAAADALMPAVGHLVSAADRDR